MNSEQEEWRFQRSFTQCLSELRVICTPDQSRIYLNGKEILDTQHEEHSYAASFAGLLAHKLGYAVTLTNLDTPLNLANIESSALETIRFLHNGSYIGCDGKPGSLCPVCTMIAICDSLRGI